MDTDAADVAGPTPLCAAVMIVVVVLATDQVPVAVHLAPVKLLWTGRR